MKQDRQSEWFVPAFGPVKLRVFLGLLFLPYTGMVLAFVAIGSAMAERPDWGRVGTLIVVYFLALGVAAHALDGLGRRGTKPWGKVFSEGQLWTLALSCIVVAYLIGIYYVVLRAPLLWTIAIPEGFFVFAYSLEWFNGRYHTDAWFAFSWGSLPVLAGYVSQTNRVSLAAALVAASMGLLSLVEIKASRPYKAMKQALVEAGNDVVGVHIEQLESILKSISVGVMLLGLGLLSLRLLG